MTEIGKSPVTILCSGLPGAKMAVCPWNSFKSAAAFVPPEEPPVVLLLLLEMEEILLHPYHPLSQDTADNVQGPFNIESPPHHDG